MMAEIVNSGEQEVGVDDYARIGRADVMVTSIGVNLFFNSGENDVQVSLTAAEAVSLASFIASYRDALTSELAKDMDASLSSQEVVSIHEPSRGPDPIPRNPHYNFPGE